MVPEGRGADIKPQAQHGASLAVERHVDEVLLYGHMHGELDGVATTDDELSRRGRGHHCRATIAAILLTLDLLHDEAPLHDVHSLTVLGDALHLDERLAAARAQVLVFAELDLDALHVELLLASRAMATAHLDGWAVLLPEPRVSDLSPKSMRWYLSLNSLSVRSSSASCSVPLSPRSWAFSKASSAMRL